MSLTHEERQRLNICGLLPPAYRTMTEQLHAVATNFAAQTTDLHRYMYLRELRNRHERLYFQFVTDHVKEVMPIVYTPTVGAACVHFSLLHFAIMGMYVCKFDKGRIVDVIKNWPEKDIRAVCITDGERILGLGDQGANGMGIPVGKLDLYTALGKIPPEFLMPVLLDVGTNNKQHLADPLYIGVRQERIRGEEYDELVQELMDAIVECWGPQTLIHFEEVAENIYMSDSSGLLTKDRKNVLPSAKPFLKDMPPNKNLEDLVKQLKPSIILGATGVGGLFTENIIRSMAKSHKRPAIFAVSNPTSKAECTAEQAYNFTEVNKTYFVPNPLLFFTFKAKLISLI